MSAARPLLAASVAIAALSLSLAVPEQGPARAAERGRPGPRLAGLASVPLGPVADVPADAPVVAPVLADGFEAPAGPRRCAPVDPPAWRPEPGPGRQRCGEPRAFHAGQDLPARTRCGTPIPD